MIIFEYIFYKLYRSAKLVRGTAPVITSAVLTVLFFYLPLTKFIYFLNKKNYIDFKINIYLEIFILIIFCILSMIYFEYKNRYLKIINRFKEENLFLKYFTDVVFIILWILIIIFLFYK